MKEYTVRVYDDDGKLWLLNDLLHREDGPAIEWADGTKMWYLNGKLHREDGAAIEWADGSKSWYLNGKRHREDGAAIEWADGSKSWYLNGKHHREEEFNRLQKPMELTIEQIAEKFGISVNKLKIKA